MRHSSGFPDSITQGFCWVMNGKLPSLPTEQVALITVEFTLGTARTDQVIIVPCAGAHPGRRFWGLNASCGCPLHCWGAPDPACSNLFQDRRQFSLAD